LNSNSEKLFDPIRRKWLVATPEERVRQLVLSWMLENLPYSKSRYRTEFSLEVNGLRKRCDILVFDEAVKPFLLVECKAPSIPINDEVLYQALRYNYTLQVAYILITNGLDTFTFQLDYTTGSYNAINLSELA
jgi:hypothetical protein